LQKAILTGFGAPDADKLLIFKFLIIRNIVTHLGGGPQRLGSLMGAVSYKPEEKISKKHQAASA